MSDREEWFSLKDRSPERGESVLVKTDVDIHGKPIDPAEGYIPGALSKVTPFAVASCWGDGIDVEWEVEVDDNSGCARRPAFVPTHWKRLCVD